jgi:hypothetical protein
MDADSHRGWSVLELVIALSLASVAVAAIAGLLHFTIRSAQVTENRLEAQQAARRAIERVTEELRWADAVLPEPGCGSPGLCADRVHISIPSGNPYRRDQPYAVLFQYNRRQRELERRVGRTVNNVASRIDRVEFTFLDSGGAPTTAPADVARVRLALQVSSAEGPPVLIESEVMLRNRRVPYAPPTARPVWRPSPRGVGEPIPPDRVVPPGPPGPSEPR